MVINTRYSKRRLLVARRTKEANGALFPYSWIGPFWKDFPFLNIILISFSDTIPYLSPHPHLPSLLSKLLNFPNHPSLLYSLSFITLLLIQCIHFFFPLEKAHYWFVRTIIFFLLFYAHTKSLSYAIHTGPRTSLRFFFLQS